MFLRHKGGVFKNVERAWGQKNFKSATAGLRTRLEAPICDTGYPHDGRADNAAYRHDRRADKRRYPHDREIDI